MKQVPEVIDWDRDLLAKSSGFQLVAAAGLWCMGRLSAAEVELPSIFFFSLSRAL